MCVRAAVCFDESHRVLFVDEIWLTERLVVLICCSEDRVVSWYMAQSEKM